MSAPREDEDDQQDGGVSLLFNPVRALLAIVMAGPATDGTIRSDK